MSPNPPPRPALSRAGDADVHPAAPGVPSLTTRLPGPAATKAGGAPSKTRKGKAAVKDEGKVVELVVPLPKALRRRLKDKAADHGYTAEEAAYHLLRVWVDG